MTPIPFQSIRERWHADPEYRAAYEEVSLAMDLAFVMAEAAVAVLPAVVVVAIGEPRIMGMAAKLLRRIPGSTSAVPERDQRGRDETARGQRGVQATGEWQGATDRV